jgi:hypothetical protein
MAQGRRDRLRGRCGGLLRGAMLTAVLLALPGGLFAQFAHIDPLSFTRPFGESDPLPQVLEIASTGANIGFAVTVSTSSGGAWLSASPAGNCCVTPHGVSVIVTTSAAMAVGTYNGQVVFSASGQTSLTVPVTLVIAPAGGVFFDNTPGQLSFTMQPGGQPPPQVMQIRNAGAGPLNWTLVTSTFNGAPWVSVSAQAGTAPSLITVGIVPQNLPNGGATPGTYSGQLQFQTAGAGSVVTVPIGLTVAADIMPQVNALSFTKPFGGADPLPQTVTIADTGAAFGFSVSSSTGTGSTGGTWLTASPAGNCCASPRAITITAHPAVALAAGTYAGQVEIDNGSDRMVIPVTLTISPPNVPFFDNVAGQLSFSLATGATTAPPNQLVQIRNAGAGTLNWTLTPATFDSAAWLTVSSTSGTAPAQISVGIVPQNLPNGALTAGVYTANLLFLTGGSSVTVPITVSVGAGFEQVNGIGFTMPQTGATPLAQHITIASTGAQFGFSVASSTATGGNWLTVSPAGNCCATPRVLTATVTAPPTMPAGVYTAEIIVYSGTTSMTVPVTLTVAAPTNPTFFDNVPGQLSFSLKPGGQAPSPQVFQLRNGGSGTLNWNLTATTSDGGNWLTVSAPSGTAPSLITVGVVPANLPNLGLVAGVFTGQLLFEGGGSTVTVPISVDVGNNVFGQVNGINFTMPLGGANPLPQVITATSTGTAIGFSVSADTATGGNWLTVSPAGNCCATPRALTVSINTAPTLAAGTYTGQVTLLSGTTSQTVPVTLTVAPPNTPFFDNVPGQLSYSLATHAGNPPSQSVQIRNRGAGTLNWTAQPSTFDGGNWLTVSAPAGTAPSLLSVGILTQNLPNQGLVAGVFTGQVLLLSGTSSVTFPVSVVVGGNGFAQVNGINFTMPLAGANPLPQVLTTTSIGAAVGFSVSAFTANGGNWMTVSPAGNCCATPRVLTVTVSAPPGLPAGSYTGEVVLDDGATAMAIPVTLTVASPAAPFFDNVPGQMSFFAATAGSPASQTLQIRGLGAGSLNWTVTPMTADNGNWLTVSANTGTAPSTLTVGIVPQNLPNQGLVAGQFTGQLLFQSGSSSITVPVSVQLGPNIFSQLGSLNFSMQSGGANPLSQNINVTSSGAAIGFAASFSSGNGGNWLSISPSGNCCATPRVITFSVNGAPGTVVVPPGTYTGQAVFNASVSAVTVPVILTVQGTASWSIAKTHVGSFTPGQTNAVYTVTVSNQAGGPTSGTATVTETVPSGLTLVSMAGTGWTCPGGNTCTRSDALAPGASYPPITVTVNVNVGATSPQVNSVAVSGGGSATASTTDPTTIVTLPVLGIAKTHTGNFTQSQANAAYTVTVSNALGAAGTSGTVTVTETVPPGLTLVSMAGSGWTCPALGNTCTRNDVLAGGASYPAITVTVNVAPGATSPQVNNVSVSGGGSASASANDSTNINPPPVALRFVPVTPCRVADTRNPAGPFGGPQIAGGATRDFIIPNSACGVPVTAQAYSLNVAVVPAGPLGFLTLWPSGQGQPLASTLNSLDGRIKSNAAIVPAGAGGAISVFASNATDVILDINGYFVPATDPTALAFYPITPCRVADTRNAPAPLGGPSLFGGQSRTFPIPSAAGCNIPAGAQAWSLNFAAVPKGPLGFVTAWPTGQNQPLVASLNALTGTVTANAAIVPAGTNGAIDVFASNGTDLIIDINGYFAPPAAGGLSLYNVAPCRVLDTRQAAGAFSGKLDVPVAASACGVPAAAQAHVVSATVVPSGPLGFLTLWPQGQVQPNVATLNALDGAITSNLAIVPTANGTVSALVTNLSQLILDVFGYFAP